jgi:cyanophycin synthetase
VGGEDDLVVDVAPNYILQAGLPYAHSDIALVLDDQLTDVPERYRDPERAARLVAVVADAVVDGGIVIAPATAWEVQDRARDAGCRVAVFAADDSITSKDKKVARASAWARDGRIHIEHGESVVDGGELRDDAPAAAQVAAALAAFTLEEMQPSLATTPEIPLHATG